MLYDDRFLSHFFGRLEPSTFNVRRLPQLDLNRDETWPVIFHVDMDAFFASCVLRERPELRDKPVIIGPDPRKGPTRGVVQTANYVARKFGITSGMSVKQALRLCPDAVFLQGSRELYREVSRSVMKILREFVSSDSQLKIYSIDEAALNLSDQLDWNDVDQIIELIGEIKVNVWKKERVTCSIGVAHHRILAKIASGLQKPNGLTIIPPDKVLERLNPLPLKVIPGIGKKTARRLEDQGLRFISDLTRRPRNSFLSDFLIHVWDLLHGNVKDSVFWRIKNGEKKSISKQRTLDVSTRKVGELISVLKRLISSVHSRMIKNEYYCRSITLIVRFDNFRTINRTFTFVTHHGDYQLLVDAAEDMLVDVLQHHRHPIRLLGVRVTDLKKYQKSTLVRWFRGTKPITLATIS